MSQEPFGYIRADAPRQCLTCLEVKPISEMRLHPPYNGVRKPGRICKKCYAAQKRDQYASDIERRALQIAYSHNASKRVKGGNLGWVEPQFVANLLRSTHTCPCCGKPREDGELFHLDHIQPLSRGGRHEESNLQVLCDFCNMAKQEKTNEELVAWIEGIRHRATGAVSAPPARRITSAAELSNYPNLRRKPRRPTVT